MSDMFDVLWDAPMSNRGTLIVRVLPTGETVVEYPGMETGTLRLERAARVPGLGVVASIHEAGRSYWAARGERGYSPATMHTVLLDMPANQPDGPTGYRYRFVQLAHVNLNSNAEQRALVSAVEAGRLPDMFDSKTRTDG